ncbi:MAG: class I SAM-dependent methyltransferase, partial [Planctomycetota bacterium]
RHDLRGRTVVEIGCGEGEFLARLCRHGSCHGIGFDPAFDESRAGHLPAGVVVRPQAFDETQLDETPGLICCRHVLEHLERPLEFLRSLRRSFGDHHGGALVIEVPDAAWAFGRTGVWDLIYEHCSSFTNGCLEQLLRRAAFEPTRVRRTYGGQFIVAEARPAARSSTGPGVAAAETASLVRGFDRRFNAHVSSWSGALGRVTRAGRAAVWGAGSKGVTFLNVLDQDRRTIEYVVDLNPRKQGRFVSGTGHVILAPDDLRTRPPTHVIAMNPLYREEIADRLRSLELAPRLLVA